MNQQPSSRAPSRRRQLTRLLGAAAVVAGATAATAGAAAGTAGASRSHQRAHGKGHALSAKAMKALRAEVAKAEAVPSFTSPGPAVKDVKGLRGKKVMIIPGTTHIPTCVQIADAAAQLASAAGMKPTVFQTSSGSQGWTQGIEDAIHQHYAAVMLECALDPAEVAPAIAQAQASGVRVTAYGPTPAENAATKLSAADADPYYQDEIVSVAQALVASKGKPLNSLVIESQDSPSNPIQLAGYEHELHAYCPGCTTTKVNVNIADWANSFASTVTSKMLASPKVNTVFAFYSGELPYLLSGLEAAHRTDVKSFGTFGQGAPDLKIQVTKPGKDIVMGDIAASPAWTGYELFYQTALVLNHQRPKPLNGYFTPNRLATPQNAGSFLKTGGFGTAFVNGYRHLLHLPALKGAALHKAAMG